MIWPASWADQFTFRIIALLQNSSASDKAISNLETSKSLHLDLLWDVYNIFFSSN